MRFRRATMMRHVDTIIEHGTVLTMDTENRVIENGAVAVIDHTIVAVGTAETLREQFAADRVLDARHMAVLPGLVDAYGHAGHGLIKSIHRPQMGWPANAIYFHATTDAWWYAEGMLSALERLKSGVTCGLSVVGATPARVDDPIFAQRQAEAAAEMGVRAVLGVGPPDPFISHLPEPWTATVWENGLPVERPFTYAQTVENTKHVIRQWHGAADGRIQVALHYPYLFGRHAEHPRFPFTYDESHVPVILEKAGEMHALAMEFGTILHSHVFAGSIDFALRHWGVQRVESLLDETVVLAHANGLGPDEVRLLGANRVNVVTVPYTHENIWYGPCPTVELLQAGANVAISTDGTTPYASYDLLRQISHAIWNQWTASGSQQVLPPGKALRMVTIDAARALGLAEEIGSLEVGKRADLILVNLAQPHLTPSFDIPRLLCHYANGADVDTVMVDGKLLMRNRNVLSVDEQTILAQAREAAQIPLDYVDISPYLATDEQFWQGWRFPGDEPFVAHDGGS